MNAKSFAAITTIVLATALNQPITGEQVSQVVVHCMFNTVQVQRFPLQSNQLLNSAPPRPPVEGAPDDRTPAGSHVAPLWMDLSEALL
jgi:hypothetical protein